MSDKDLNGASKGSRKSSLGGYLNRDNWGLTQIFDAVTLGVVFLDFKKRTVLFSNAFFRSLVKDKEGEVMDDIYKYIDRDIDQQGRFRKPYDLVISEQGEELKLGFTVYRLDGTVMMILLRQIASRSIYLESRQKSQFYDKLSELVAEMAHEIGNPLSGINTSLQVMLQNITAWPLEKVRDYIERTINEIDRLSDFLKRIREVSRESKLDIRPANLRRILEDVWLQNEALLKQKKISFSNLVDEDIDVLVDEGSFYQIILNLIHNSMQILTPHQEIKIYVEEVDDLYVKLVYRNNGVPIPEELMEKIFSPLYTTKTRGDGIGLAISLKLMTRMGGAIKAIPPEDGVGAKFLLYIPY